MKQVEVKAEAIGFDKPFMVEPSVKNYKKSNKILIEMLQMQALANRSSAVKVTDPNYADAAIKALEAEDHFMDSGVQYLKEILKLTTKQVHQVEDNLSDGTALADYASYVIQRVKGISDEEIETGAKRARQERANQDPKK